MVVPGFGNKLVTALIASGAASILLKAAQTQQQGRGR